MDLVCQMLAKTRNGRDVLKPFSKRAGHAELAPLLSGVQKYPISISPMNSRTGA